MWLPRLFSGLQCDGGIKSQNNVSPTIRTECPRSTWSGTRADFNKAFVWIELFKTPISSEQSGGYVQVGIKCQVHERKNFNILVEFLLGLCSSKTWRVLFITSRGYHWHMHRKGDREWTVFILKSLCHPLLSIVGFDYEGIVHKTYPTWEH